MASKKPSMIDSLRAKHDPHYQLSGKVESLEQEKKDIPIKIAQLHKTLSKSFGMQRKTLIRVAGLEGKVKDNETRISNLADIAISIAEESEKGKERSQTGEQQEQGVGDWEDEVGGDWDATTGAKGGINGESFLGEESYDKFADELQQSGTISGIQLSPQERKEGFKKKKKPLDFKKFVGKIVSKKGGDANGKKSSVGKQKLLPGTKGGDSSAAADVKGVSKGEEDGEGEKEPDVKKIVTFLRSVLDPSLTKIEENLDKILGNLEGKVEADKDKADDIKQDADSAADDAREKKLEGKGGDKIVGPAFNKAIKPVTGFLQMMLKFFLNVVLGGIVMKLLKIIENPKVLLDHFFLVINGISIVLNQLIKAIWFISTAPTRILKNALQFSINNLIGAINIALGALKNFGLDFSIPKVDFPDIPQAPQIPMIPLSWSAQDAGSAPAVAMAGGGLVPGEKGDTGEKGDAGQKGDYWEGRGDTSHFGSPGYRMGQVLPEQLIYNFDKFTSSSTEVGGKIVDEKEELIELGGSIGMPDLIEHQTQLVDSLRKEKGYEDVNFMDVMQYPHNRGKLVSMPQQQLYPIFNASDAWKASDAKRDAAMKLDDDNNLLFLDPTKVAEKVGGFNKGGKVPGKGKGDIVPAMLTPGEFVMSKGAVDQIGVQNLMAMNKAGGGTNKPQLMKFAGGGEVPGAPGPRKKGGVTVISGSKGPSSGNSTSGSGGDQSGVSAFSAQDTMNTDMLLIKSIYNIAG